jgi:hypothetical protein
LADGLTPTEDKTNLEALKRMVTESTSLTSENRLQQQKDDDYYHGYQLTRVEKRVLKRRKQPDNTWNYTRLAINGTLGVIKQGQTDPRAYPRNPQDEDSADIASKVLRWAADGTNFDAKKIDIAYDYLVPGTGAAIVEVDEDRRPTVEQIRHEEFIYDPHSRRQDFSDARYMGIAKWQWADDLKREYPKLEADIDHAMSDASLIFDTTQEDRPTDAGHTMAWADRKQRRLMVVELYYREGQEWHRCKFVSSVKLESGPSPYLDAKKRPCCPIEAQSCYVDRENNRAGLVRDMRGPQDEINKRSSKLLHELNTRQIQEASPGAGMGDVDVARSEAARPDGVIPSGWVVVSRQDVVAGQEKLLQNAVAAMSRFSPNPAVLGREGENQSGRSNLIRQQAGLTEQAVTFGGVEEWELRIYRQMWNRCRQYMTGPDFIRVTDDEGAPTFLGINQPPTMPGPPQMGPDGQPIPGEPQPLPPMPDPNAQPDANGAVPQLVEDGKPAFRGPNGEKVLGYENSIAELDVDITLDTVPDVANVAQEQFNTLSELAKVYGPQEVPFDDLLETSTLPGKRKLLEKRKARAEEGKANPQAELQLRGAQAEVAKTESEVALNQAKTQTEALKPELEAAKLYQQAQAGDAQREQDERLQSAGMAQKDRQFDGQMSAKAFEAANRPPPGR